MPSYFSFFFLALMTCTAFGQVEYVNSRDLVVCEPNKYCESTPISDLPKEGKIDISSYRTKIISENEVEVKIGNCSIDFNVPVTESIMAKVSKTLYFSNFTYIPKANGLNDANCVDIFQAQVDDNLVKSVTCKISRWLSYSQGRMDERVYVIAAEFEYDAQLFFKE